ncbi:Alpha-(1,3)-fucosyltransferase 9 [Triplophysa tibetana]|uniref:Fucosyltransferase n=1 Tax=Triplophysa tibetana TaxID=1572043 RepID=A0A5A9NLT3_9TELE|nr:Alpha-(1,3)-fucosyltransferase 9 [Triplophysa tibetana]
MMESQRWCQHILIAAVFLSCVFAIFYMYYSPTINRLHCPALQVSKHNVCADACINHSQIRNNTCAVNLTVLNNQLKEAKPSSPSQSETLLLIWMRPFGQNIAWESCSSQFQIEGCQLTDDRNLFNTAHGILFHHRDIHQDLSNMPTLPRPYFQKWVWMNMESPSNSGLIPGLNALFNLTTSYRRDSDITVPYGQTSERSADDRTYQIPQKEKFICWIVSNWNPDHERSKYYEKLKEHVSVETFGKSFNRYVSDGDYPKLVSICKFYLSFENSIHEDYITEKLFNPMTLGTVPVVLGPSRKNYERFIPADSFIHVDDFKTAGELAEHLKVLHQNTDMYVKYFGWRERHAVRGTLFGLEQACRSCDHIRRNRNYRTVNDLNTWYWG